MTTIPAQSTKIAIALVTTFAVSQASAQSAGSADAEIAALKKQLRLMEEKLDRLQKQTAANTAAAAKANAKAEAKAKVGVVEANGIVPVKAPPPPPEAIIKMPNNQPTICTADEQNCIALTSRLNFDAGGYDYRPNTANTNPQRLDNGVNARRALRRLFRRVRRYRKRNIRFMFDYLHGNIAKQISPTNAGDAGAKFDAFAMRTQVAF